MKDYRRQSTTPARRVCRPLLLVPIAAVMIVALLLTSFEAIAQPSSFPALVPKCRTQDLNPRIAVTRCKATPGLSSAKCSRLVRQCRCQHNIVMKNTGPGCLGSRGTGVSFRSTLSPMQFPCAP